MSDTDTTPQSTAKRRPARAGRSGFARAGSLVERQIRKTGESRGFAVSRLLTHWSEVVGADLATLCRPVRASYARGGFGATLTVLAAGAAAPIVQARLPELRARVNACYGYNAVARIRVTQTAPEGFAAPARPFKPAPAQPQPSAPAAHADRIAAVRDPALRAALTALAAHIPASPDA